MGSTDLTRLRRRLRWTYEFARLRRALLGVLPLLVIVAGAGLFAQRPVSTLGFGLSATAVGAAMLWYGRDPQKAVFPGVAAGLVPLAFALCASHIHACGPDGCRSLCVPACSLGGVVAGLAIARVGTKRNAGPWFWLSATSLALLTGAMGCTCLGYSGLFGLGLGFGAGVIPGLVLRRLRRNST